MPLMPLLIIDIFAIIDDYAILIIDIIDTLIIIDIIDIIIDIITPLLTLFYYYCISAAIMID
jgi:hypothetical protein